MRKGPAVSFDFPAEGRSRETAIRRDAQGRWWNGEVEITHPALTRAFDAWIDRAEDERYCLRNEVNWAYVTIEGAPIVARGASVRTTPPEIWLALSDGREERLDLETLREDRDGTWYCDVRGGTIPCRLDGRAVAALADCLETDATGSVQITLGAIRVRPARVLDPLAPSRAATIEVGGSADAPSTEPSASRNHDATPIRLGTRR